MSRAVSRRALAVVIGAVAATSLAGGASTLAASHHTQPAVNLGSAKTTSTGYAGYFTSPSDGIASSVSSFTVPTVTCASTSDFADLEDIVFNSQGTPVAYDNLYLDCSSGTPAEYVRPYTSGAGDGARMNVNPGDKLLMDVYATSSNTTAITFDQTQGTSVSQSDGSADASGYPLTSAGPAVVTGFGGPIPNFGSVYVHNLAVNGEPLAALSTNAFALKTGSDIQANAQVMIPSSAYYLKFLNEY